MNLSQFVVNTHGILCLVMNPTERMLLREALNRKGKYLELNAVRCEQGRLYMIWKPSETEAE